MSHSKFDKSKPLYKQSPLASVVTIGSIDNLQDAAHRGWYIDDDAQFSVDRCPLDDRQVNSHKCTYLDRKCEPMSSDCWLKILTDNIKQEIAEYPFAGYPTYQEYLKSEHWQETRLKALEHYANHCNLCGSTEGLNVHHNNYDRLGNEEMTDLTVLCRDCHAKFHDKEI